MATKYAAAVCAVTYREADSAGKYVGGPMYYLRNGEGAFAPELGKWLGLAFAIFGAVAAGIGNAVQVNSVAAALVNSFGVPTWLTGVPVAVLVGIVVVGGIRRIGEVAGRLVPAMIVLYLGAALLIIAMFGTFIDTLVVCTLTALVILTSGACAMTGACGGGLTGAVLTSGWLPELDCWRPVHRHQRPGHIRVHHHSRVVVLRRAVLAVPVQCTEPDGLPRVVGAGGAHVRPREGRFGLELGGHP